MERYLFEWLTRYGTPILFLAQMLGIFGLPIPDELLLTIAGALVRNGRLNGGETLVAAISGCTAGISLSYILGRTVGVATLRRVGHFHPETFARTHKWFERFGCWLLAFGYFIPGVRHVTAIAAGSASLEYKTFAAYAYPGAVVWSTTFVTLGYFAGSRQQEMLDLVRRHAVTGAVLATGVVLAYAGWKILRRVRSQRGPGPQEPG